MYLGRLSGSVLDQVRDKGRGYSTVPPPGYTGPEAAEFAPVSQGNAVQRYTQIASLQTVVAGASKGAPGYSTGDEDSNTPSGGTEPVSGGLDSLGPNPYGATAEPNPFADACAKSYWWAWLLGGAVAGWGATRLAKR